MDETSLFLHEMGQRIYERRKQLYMTQEQLAEKMNVTPQMLSYTELGKKAIRPENLLKLSQALSVSADYLLTGNVSEGDYDRISKKLKAFGTEDLMQIETILDACLTIKKNP